MPIGIQEQSSTFSSKTTKSVKVVQSSGSIDSSQSSGVGELYIPSTEGQQQQQVTSSTSVQKSQQVSSTSSQQGAARKEHDVSTSTSCSSISSDNTLRDISRLDDFSFRPSFMKLGAITGIDSDFEDVSRQVCHVNEGQTFEVKLDVQEYKPEEIQVKISDNLVIITAKQEVRIDENNFRSRQFSKKFSIPQGVKPENISCNLTKKGELKISAPIESQQRAITGGSTTASKQQNESTTSTSTQQAQHKQVSKTQKQESVTSSRKSSINSDISSIVDEFVIRPRRTDIDALMSRQDSNLQEVSRELGTVNDGRKFEMKMEVQNFKPEEIEVKITKSLIKVEGKHESQFASRSFYKEFTIPHGVKADTIQCTFTEDGVLTISAPIQSALDALTSTIDQQEQRVTQQQQVKQQQQQVTQQQQQVTQQQQVKQQQHKTSVTENTTNSARRMLEEDCILRPIMDLESLMSTQTSQFEDVSKDLCSTGDGQKFEVKLDVPDYKPDELQVKISNNMVTIEGKQETTFSSKSFFKKFSIPQGVKPESITSSLSPKGVLTLSAPIERTDSSADVSRKISNSTVTQQQVIQSNQTQQQVQQQQQQVQQEKRTQQQEVTQQQVQQQQVTQQVQQQQKTSVRKEQVQQSDSNSSIASNVSRRLEDFVLRPIIDKIDMDSVLARDTRFEDISKELSQVNDANKFETKLDVAGFRPEELEVKISNNMVTISGKTEMREENNFSSRSFFKKFSIPQGVKPENISSSLSPQGVLTISAPVDRSLASQQAITSSTVTKTQQQQQQEVTSQRNISQQQQVQQQKTSSVHSDSLSSLDTSALSSNIHKNIVKRLSEEDFFLRPIIDLNSILDRESRFEDVSKQICKPNTGDKFEVKLDVPDFKPEELEVKISNNMVTIQGKQEMRAENNFSSRSFCKKFSIPQGVKPESISSSLSNKGVLTLFAPIDKSLQQGGGLNQAVEQRQSSTTTTSSSSTQRITSSNNTGNNFSRLSSVIQPKINVDSAPSTIPSNFEDVSKELCHINDGQTFEMKLDVKDYAPEEIEVKISQGVVTIEGKQEMKQENNFQSRSFSKKFTMPHGVRPEGLSCSIGTDGALCITAPIESSSSPSSALSEVQQQQKQQQQTSSTKKVTSTFTSSTTSQSSNF